MASYGVWRKRGKHFSSIEIDNAGVDAFYQWQRHSERYGNAEARKRMYKNMGLGCDDSLYSQDACDDFYYLQWAYNQRRKGWKIYEVQTRSDHTVWLSVPNPEFVQDSLSKLSFPVDAEVKEYF